MISELICINKLSTIKLTLVITAFLISGCRDRNTASTGLLDKKTDKATEPSQSDLPSKGRSLFDSIFISGNSYQIPNTYSEINQKIEEALNSRSCSTLIPLGRSLQRKAASPLFFELPRIITGIPEGVDASDQIFFAFSESRGEMEVISFNQALRRYEFQVVRDIGVGLTAHVEYPRRDKCVVCHQNEAPIFPEFPWSETTDAGSNKELMDLVMPAKSEAAKIVQEKRLFAANGNSCVPLIDVAARRIFAQQQSDILWASCTKSKSCKTDLLKIAFFQWNKIEVEDRLRNHGDFAQLLQESENICSSATWPAPQNLPDRVPLNGILERSKTSEVALELKAGSDPKSPLQIAMQEAVSAFPPLAPPDNRETDPQKTRQISSGCWDRFTIEGESSFNLGFSDILSSKRESNLTDYKQKVSDRAAEVFKPDSKLFNVWLESAEFPRESLKQEVAATHGLTYKPRKNSHIDGTLANLPESLKKILMATVEAVPSEGHPELALFVTYCSGCHSNKAGDYPFLAASTSEERWQNVKGFADEIMLAIEEDRMPPKKSAEGKLFRANEKQKNAMIKSITPL